MTTNANVEVANIELAMQILQNLIPDALDHAPREVQEKFNNALLNIAINRIIEIEGKSDTVDILLRLVNALVNDCLPLPENPIMLSKNMDS